MDPGRSCYFFCNVPADGSRGGGNESLESPSTLGRRNLSLVVEITRVRPGQESSPWGVSSSSTNSYIAMDLRLVDVETGVAMEAVTVNGRTSDWSVGVGAEMEAGDIDLSGSLNQFEDTPMEKAVRVLIARSVDATSKMVPEKFYRH